jgi:hypothetical protein
MLRSYDEKVGFYSYQIIVYTTNEQTIEFWMSITLVHYSTKVMGVKHQLHSPNSNYFHCFKSGALSSRDISWLMHTFCFKLWMVLILIMGSVLMAMVLLRNDTYGGHAPPQPNDVFLLQNMAYNCCHSTWLPLLSPENKWQWTYSVNEPFCKVSWNTTYE